MEVKTQQAANTRKLHTNRRSLSTQTKFYRFYNEEKFQIRRRTSPGSKVAHGCHTVKFDTCNNL